MSRNEKVYRRFLAFMMAVVMLFGSLPINAFAENMQEESCVQSEHTSGDAMGTDGQLSASSEGVEVLSEKPAEIYTEEAAEKPAEEPIEEPTEESAEESAEVPMAELTEQPMEEPVQEEIKKTTADEEFLIEGEPVTELAEAAETERNVEEKSEEEFQPVSDVRVSMPMPDDYEGDVSVYHIDDEGATQLETKDEDGVCLFSTDGFSPLLRIPWLASKITMSQHRYP